MSLRIIGLDFEQYCSDLENDNEFIGILKGGDERTATFHIRDKFDVGWMDSRLILYEFIEVYNK